MIYRTFYDCRFLPIDMPEDRRIQIARDAAVRSIAEYIGDKITMEYDPQTNTVRGTLAVGCPCFEIPPKANRIIQCAIDRLATIEDILGPDYDLDRLRALMKADREGLVRIARRPPLEDECCGNCGHFRRITGTARGDCAVREYTGKPWRGKFTPCQSRKACRQFQRRTEEHGRSDSEEGRDEAPAAGIPGDPAAGAGE